MLGLKSLEVFLENPDMFWMFILPIIKLKFNIYSNIHMHFQLHLYILIKILKNDQFVL